MHLRDLCFFAYHGVHAEERRAGGIFRVSLCCTLSQAAAAPVSDCLAGTVDYEAVYAQVRDVMKGTTRTLIEHLAYSIAHALLREHALMAEVRVEVSKEAKEHPMRHAACSVTLSQADAAE